MRLGLVLSIVSVAQVAACSLNAMNGTGCAQPEISSCLSVCSLYMSNNSCSTVSGCAWTTNTSTCGNVNDTCSSRPTSIDCGGDPMCSWVTTPCKFTELCQSTNLNFTCNSFNDSSSCGANGCMWNKACDRSSACGLLNDQTSCTSRAGCTWLEAVLGSNTSSYVATACGPCFADPSNIDNNPLMLQSFIGQVCDLSVLNFFLYIRVLSVTSASTGCSGGVPAPAAYHNCSAAVPSAAPSAPSTSAPSSSGGTPSTSAPSSGGTPSTSTPSSSGGTSAPSPSAGTPSTSAPSSAGTPSTSAPSSGGTPSTHAPSTSTTSAPTQMPTELPDVNVAAPQTLLAAAAVFVSSMLLCF